MSASISPVLPPDRQVPVRQAALAASTPQSTLTAGRKVIESLALVRPKVKWALWEEGSVGTSRGASKEVLRISGVSCRGRIEDDQS